MKKRRLLFLLRSAATPSTSGSAGRLRPADPCFQHLHAVRRHPHLSGRHHDFVDEGDGPWSYLARSRARTIRRVGQLRQPLHRLPACIRRMPREEATQYISEEEYDSLPWSWRRPVTPAGRSSSSAAWPTARATVGHRQGYAGYDGKVRPPKSWLDRDDGATNSNLIYNGFPNHHGPAEAWQVGMLYNLVYNRDCMIHDDRLRDRFRCSV